MNDPLEAVVRSWCLPPWATFFLLLTAVLYLRGWRQAQVTRPEELPPWRAACFLAGLCVAWLAIASPLDALDSLSLSAHMVQHFLLMSVAPPLLLLGAPTVPMLRGIPRVLVREVVGPLLSAKPVLAVGRFLAHPVVGWLAMNVAYIGWHLPGSYELALHSESWHAVEHGCFFFTSLLFWWTVLQPWPSRCVWSRWAVLPSLIGADLVNTALSAVLVFSGRVFYPTYAQAPRLFGVSAMNDQAAAGAFMWVFGSIVFLVPALVITMHLLSPRRKIAPHAKGLVSIQNLRRKPLPLDVLRMSVAGRFLRSRYGRQLLQAGSLVIAVMVILHGLFGHQMGSMNLAGVVVWNVVRALGVLVLIFAGNLFCMACPFMLPRELGHRLGLAKLHWPPWLRVKWIAAALMVVFFWSYERYALWDNPARTAWLLIAYFAAAFLIDTFFRGASFCRYVCPIGQFNFLGSLLSPTELNVRSHSTCASCATRDCIKGNAQQRGCEYDLYLPQKQGNINCTLCMDCVKACPHDNIGLFARPVARDILSDPLRSSVRRLSGRVDIAVVALVLVFSSFANAAAMVAPGSALLSWLGRRAPVLDSAGGSIAAVFAIAVLLIAVVWIVARAMRWAGAQLSTKRIFCRFSLALLPLGMGMWAAHLLFHLLTSAPALWPVTQQAAHDFGLGLLGSPQWMISSPFSGNGLLQLQLCFLDAGLLLTLYLGWRIAGQVSRGIGRATAVLLPWAVSVSILYALGIWLLTEPMQMHGAIMMGGM